ncbi:MAG: hypothetical protein ACOYB1_00740 [Limnohabitans sp.]
MSFRSVFRSRVALTLCLVAALLWAPIWGQWHGIAHQVRQEVSAAAPALSCVAGHQDDGHPQGSALCQVLDHLGHASGLVLGAAVLRLAVLPSALAVCALASDAGVRACWSAQARAPPHWI